MQVKTAKKLKLKIKVKIKKKEIQNLTFCIKLSELQAESWVYDM